MIGSLACLLNKKKGGLGGLGGGKGYRAKRYRKGKSTLSSV